MLVGSRTPSEPPSSLPLRGAALTGGARVDVCIVGAGLSELIAAYYLARDKRSVMLMHAGPLGLAGTELAHLSSAIPQPYDELERVHGAENARLAAQSYAAAIEALEGIVRRERIACEFERLDGFRLCESAGEAEREVAAAKRAGALSVQMTSVPPAVRHPGQVQFHPLKLMQGLARAIAREGGRIHSGVTTKGLETGKPTVLVTTAGHRIEADHVITPAEVTPTAALQGIGMRVQRGSVTRAIYWSTGSRLRCARLRGGAAPELLMVAGDDTPENLAAWARKHFPTAGDIAQRFQGEAPSATDLFAVTGLEAGEAESVHVSTASWGSAVTRAVVAGMAIRDFVVGARAPEIEGVAAPGHLALERSLS